MNYENAVVTGGSRGIGAEVARLLARGGIQVVLGCRSKEKRARRLAAEIAAGGATVPIVCVGDLRDSHVRTALLAAVKGPINVLVLAAAAGMEIGATPDDIFALNRDATVALVEEALPRLAVGATIVYLTSHQAHFSRTVAPEPEYAVVAAAKRAAEDALDSLALSIAGHGARLLVVSADIVRDSATTMLMERLRPGSTAARELQVGRLPLSAEVAKTVTHAANGSAPNRAVIYHGSSSPEVMRSECSCPRLITVGGERACGAAMVQHAVRALQSKGVTATARIVVSERSGTALAVLMLAAIRMGVSLVVLDDCVPDHQLRQRIAESQGDFLVSSGAHVGSIKMLGSAAQFLASEPLLCRGEHADLEDFFTAWRRREDALILWTSGSTGDPRGIIRSGESVVENVLATVELMRYLSSDVLVPLLPLTHQYGLSLLMIWWLTRCGLVIGNHRRPAETLRAAAAWGPTVVDMTPTVAQDLLSALDKGGLRRVLSTVRMWCVGGAPLRPSLATRFHSETGSPLLDGYGSTELGNVSLATQEVPQGLGRLLRGVRVEVRGRDNRQVAQGEVGEIWVSSPYVFAGVLGVNSPTNERREWERTGDMGHVDGSGVLHIHGRQDAVHRGGFTIYPGAIEMQTDRAGIPATIIALSDERLGAHLTAFIEDDTVRSPSAWSALLANCLSESELPNRVVVLPKLPRLNNGKVDRVTLSKRAHDARTRIRRSQG